MNTKNIIRLIVVAVLLFSSFAAIGGAHAWSSCPNYVTVQWGDTLSGIAATCGTTVEAIQAANPGLGWWVYAGQVLYIPTGYASAPVYYPPSGNTYVVQQGDTLGKIAARSGVSWRDILAVNPQIQNPSLIYAGQVINLPAGASAPSPIYTPAPSYPPHPAPVTDSYSIVRITYRYGLYIRSTIGGEIISSAVQNTYWYYNTGNVHRLEDGTVWVEVKLGEQINGRWRGWMLVKDNLGKYFTSPQID